MLSILILIFLLTIPTVVTGSDIYHRRGCKNQRVCYFKTIMLCIKVIIMWLQELNTLFLVNSKQCSYNHQQQSSTMEACRYDNTTPNGFPLPWSNSIINRLPASKPSLVSRTVCSYFGKTSASSDYKRLKWIHDNGLVFAECDQQAEQNASSFVLLFEEMCCLFKWCGQKLVPMWDKLPNKKLCQRCLWGVPEMTTDT